MKWSSYVDVVFLIFLVGYGITRVFDFILTRRQSALEAELAQLRLRQMERERDHYKGLNAIYEEYFSAMKKNYPNVGKTAKPTSNAHACHDDRCHGKGYEGHFCHNGDCERDLTQKKIRVVQVRSNACPICNAQPGDACNLDKHERPVTRPRTKTTYEA